MHNKSHFILPSFLGILAVVSIGWVILHTHAATSPAPCEWGGQHPASGTWKLPNGDTRFLCQNGIWLVGPGMFGASISAIQQDPHDLHFQWQQVPVCRQFGAWHVTANKQWMQSIVASDATCVAAATPASIVTPPSAISAAPTPTRSTVVSNNPAVGAKASAKQQGPINPHPLVVTLANDRSVDSNGVVHQTLIVKDPDSFNGCKYGDAASSSLYVLCSSDGENLIARASSTGATYRPYLNAMNPDGTISIGIQNPLKIPLVFDDIEYTSHSTDGSTHLLQTGNPVVVPPASATNIIVKATPGVVMAQDTVTVTVTIKNGTAAMVTDLISNGAHLGMIEANRGNDRMELHQPLINNFTSSTDELTATYTFQNIKARAKQPITTYTAVLLLTSSNKSDAPYVYGGTVDVKKKPDVCKPLFPSMVDGKYNILFVPYVPSNQYQKGFASIAQGIVANMFQYIPLNEDVIDGGVRKSVAQEFNFYYTGNQYSFNPKDPNSGPVTFPCSPGDYQCMTDRFNYYTNGACDQNFDGVIIYNLMGSDPSDVNNPAFALIGEPMVVLEGKAFEMASNIQKISYFLLHELFGHGIGKLVDEYIATNNGIMLESRGIGDASNGAPPAGPNCIAKPSDAPQFWKDLIAKPVSPDDKSVGLQVGYYRDCPEFSNGQTGACGCFYTDHYRATERSVMTGASDPEFDAFRDNPLVGNPNAFGGVNQHLLRKRLESVLGVTFACSQEETSTANGGTLSWYVPPLLQSDSTHPETWIKVGDVLETGKQLVPDDFLEDGTTGNLRLRLRVTGYPTSCPTSLTAAVRFTITAQSADNSGPIQKSIDVPLTLTPDGNNAYTGLIPVDRFTRSADSQFLLWYLQGDKENNQYPFHKIFRSRFSSNPLGMVTGVSLHAWVETGGQINDDDLMEGDVTDVNVNNSVSPNNPLYRQKGSPMFTFNQSANNRIATACGAVSETSGNYFITPLAFRGKGTTFGGPNDKNGITHGNRLGLIDSSDQIPQTPDDGWVFSDGVTNTTLFSSLDHTAKWYVSWREMFPNFVASEKELPAQDKQFWRDKKIIVWNPANGNAVRLRPVDFGPGIPERSDIDLSNKAMADLTGDANNAPTGLRIGFDAGPGGAYGPCTAPTGAKFRR